MEEHNRRWKSALDEAWPPELRAREKAVALRARVLALAVVLFVATGGLCMLASLPRFSHRSPSHARSSGPAPSPSRTTARISSAVSPRPWLWTQVVGAVCILARGRARAPLALPGTADLAVPISTGLLRETAVRVGAMVASVPDRRGRLEHRHLLGARAGRGLRLPPDGDAGARPPVRASLLRPEAHGAGLPSDEPTTPLDEVLAVIRTEAPYARVTSDFNDYRGRARATGHRHGGYDIGLEAGTAVPAAWPGQVVEIRPWGGSEHGITIAVGDVRVTYGHLVPRVRIGQLVHTGMILGLVGRDHVDVKIWADGGFVDFAKVDPFEAWPWEGRFYHAAGTIGAAEQAIHWGVDRML